MSQVGPMGGFARESSRPAEFGFRHSLAVLLALMLTALAACTGEPSKGEAEAEADEPQVAGEIDFTATNISWSPGQLLVTDQIQVDVTINNVSVFDSPNFEVRAFLKKGPNCDNSSHFIDGERISVDANDSVDVELVGVPLHTPPVGTYYLCVFIDALGEVEESIEANNQIGGTMYPVFVVDCLNDAACDDGNSCTDDTCAPFLGCQFFSNSNPCDDGLFCTDGDVCAGGSCQRGGVRDCVDSDLCDGAMYCDELAGACVNGPSPPPCDDGFVCNGAESCNPVDGACLEGTPVSCDALVNNGLAPPNSSNVIDTGLYNQASDQTVLLRNLGCPIFGEPDSFCPIAGSPTTLEVAAGANVADLEVFDGSVLEVTGGSIDLLIAGQDAWVDLSGGVVVAMEGYGNTTVTGGYHDLLQLHGTSNMSGGFVQSLELDSGLVSPGGTLSGGVVTTLFSGAESSVRGGRVALLCAQGEPGVIYGSGFNLPGGIFGPLPAATGFVSGTLELGDPLNAVYHQAGSWCYHPKNGRFDTQGSFTVLPPESTFIANGLAIGQPENTIDAVDVSTANHDVFIRNAGCPDGWPATTREAACALPGAATEVEIVSGAVVPGVVHVLDTSTAIIRGGQVSTLRMSAGALIEIWGDNFTIGGFAVPFGDVVDQNGTLVGTLASGDPIAVSFDREDPAAPGSYGTVVLRSAAELLAGTGVTGSLFGGLSVVGGVSVEANVASPGILSGTYELANLGNISEVIPDFVGLAMAVQGVQDNYQIWEVEFSGVIGAPGDSTVQFAYDPSIVDPEKQLVIFAWDGFEWVRMLKEYQIDEVNHVISVAVDSFTIFALVVSTFLVPVLSVFGWIALSSGLVASGFRLQRQGLIGGAPC